MYAGLNRSLPIDECDWEWEQESADKKKRIECFWESCKTVAYKWLEKSRIAIVISILFTHELR